MSLGGEGRRPTKHRAAVARTPVVLDLGQILDSLQPRPEQEFRVHVRRPDDLLVFDLVFVNLRLVAGSEPRLERQHSGAPAVMIVEFPPQSFGEEAFLATSSADDATGGMKFKESCHHAGYQPKNVKADAEQPGPLPTSRIRMAGPSRLVFTMPADRASLGFTLEDILKAMRTWEMRRDLSARPDRVLVADLPGDARTSLVDVRFGTLSEWAGLRGGLVSGLEASGMERVGDALLRSAHRVAERAAASLTSADGCSASALQNALFQGFEELADSYPDLRDGESRHLGLSALAFATAEHLLAEAARGSLELAYDDLDILPLIRMLLAPHKPSHDVTALELPYRLLLSPVGRCRWEHATKYEGIQLDGRVELWHTRLRTTQGEHGPDGAARVRAIWSPDYPYPIEEILPWLGQPQRHPPEPPVPFRMPLDALDRKMLVRLMAGWNETREDGSKYVPRSSRADRLHLSALGGLLDVEGNWDVRPGQEGDRVDLQQWRHLTTLGRDHYVRVVYAGFLCPLGHSASLIKVTERRFERSQGAPKGRVAVLRQRFFLVVRERVKTYDGSGHEYRGRNFPFKQVEILTRVTPDLVQPGVGVSAVADTSIYSGYPRRMVFWPVVPDGRPGHTDKAFSFEVVATDLAGRRVTLETPLLFVGAPVNTGAPQKVCDIYTGEPELRKRADVGGASIAYAPSDPADADSPNLPTKYVVLAARLRTGGWAPGFYPEIARAHVGVPSLRKLMVQPNALVSVVYPKLYREHGFGETDATKNRGRVFLHLVQPHPLRFGGDGDDAKSDAIGGLASPQMEIRALSLAMGPVAVNPSLASNQAKQALENIADGAFDPAQFFDDARILGGVDLGGILETAQALTESQVPKLVTRELPDSIVASFELKSEIASSDPLGLLIPKADADGDPTVLDMRGSVTTPLADPQNLDYEATAALNNFKVNLFGFVTIWFENLTFHAKKGQKPDVAVELGDEPVQFGGALEFVNTLRELIPANGFSDPPAISVTPSGISAGYSLTLPTVGVGVLTLSNLSLGAGFSLPFDSTPATVRFNFCEREQPFNLTVSMLGGGGFFAIGLTTNGVDEIEAALEFGAAVAIDLGVASGGVEVKAGVYFHWLEPIENKGSVELTGYVRLHGELSVLGLISASLTFNLQISYLKDQAAKQSIVWGEATLVIEVEILFFSVSVKAHCRREFGGSASDPKFIELVPDESVWAEYCDAFAAEAA